MTADRVIADPLRWPTAADFVWGQPVPAPESWNRPGLVMVFNLECAACVSRGVPLLKQLAQGYGERLVVVMVHTAFGHRRYPREEVVPTLRHFAETFARIPFPIALDLDGELAESWGVAGTPHWFVFAGGACVRSVYGSQAGAQTRLEYSLAELLEGAET